MLKQSVIEFSGLIGTLFIAFLVILFIKRHKASEDIYNEQQDIINSQQENIMLLEEQQKPELQIYFDEADPSCVCDEYGDYGRSIGRQIHDRTIRIRIDNLSRTKAIEGIEVKLTDIDKCASTEKGKLPVRLELKNKTSSYPDSFSIPIGGKEFFNLINAYFVVEKRKMNMFRICHIEKENNHTDIPLQFNAEQVNYKIKIEVKSDTTTCESKEYTVGLKDNVMKMWDGIIAYE